MKAVLVMEFPTCCGMCDLAYADEEGVNYTCCAMNCTLDSDIIIEQTKPTWCPLKVMPEKVPYPADMYNCGRNDCIDEVLGEGLWKE